MALYPREILNWLALMGIPRGPNSNIYLVDPTNGDDNNIGDRWTLPMATIIAAEDKCVANQHDVVLYLASSSSISMTAALTWDKNFTHLVGMCAPTQVAQRARIFQLSTLTSASPLLNITATGCIFKNFYIFQGVDDAGSLINVQVSGGRNYFENVHFAGSGHVTCAVDGSASLRLVGSSGENTFVRCTIGIDTVALATGVRGLAIIGGTPRNIFRKCNFAAYANSSGVMFVEWEALSAVDRYMLFEDCYFFNTGPQTMSEAFSIPASVPGHRRCFMVNCHGYGFTDWEASNRSVLYFAGGTQTAGGTTGLFQASNTT